MAKWEFCVPQIPQFCLLTKPSGENMLSYRSKCSLASSAGEGLACNNSSNSNRLAALNPVWKKVESVEHDTVRGHAS